MGTSLRPFLQVFEAPALARHLLACCIFLAGVLQVGIDRAFLSSQLKQQRPCLNWDQRAVN